MKTNRWVMVLLTILAAAGACRKEDEVLKTGNGLTPELVQNPALIKVNTNIEGETILGRKLENPYTVAVMQKAAAEIAKKGYRLLDPNQIIASHYYVKFMPADSVQFQLLDNVKNLTLYPYPLDHEIIREGNSYRDQSQPKEDYAWQYASVRVTQRISPKIAHQKLAELYIPEEDPLFSKGQHEDYLDALLDEAYKITHNYQDTLKIEMGKVQKKSYHPGGKIQIFDTRLNQLIGLEGVDMRARRWFTTRHARTDFWGNYRMAGTFKRPCNYSLWFSQSDFTVKPHLVALTAWIDGPKQKEDWNLDINLGYNRFIGHIFRGAYRYHYGFIDGLKRPFDIGDGRAWYIGVDNGNGSSGNNYIVFKVIRIKRYSDYREYSSDEIFSTTCHETAHTSHSMIMDLGFIDFGILLHKKMRESWAVGVEWWLTKLEYKNTRGIPNYGDWSFNENVQYPNYRGFQNWNIIDYPKYTNLYINIIDNYNEKPIFGTVEDNVNGYTLAWIERLILSNIYTLNDLKNQLKNHPKPLNVRNADIDQLLSHY